MAAQNDSNTPASSSVLHSPSQSESHSSKFLRKSKFLMKSNVNVEGSESDNCSSTNDLFPNPESSASSPHQSPSEMTASASESDIDHTTEKTSRTAEDLWNNKVTSSSPLSPVYRPPPSPIMEIIPPPLSHRLRVTTSLESATSVISESSDTNLTSTPELTEIPHTPCRLYPS
jgi:hypothetical protein